MSTIPYFLRNPNLDDQAQQPMIMAPAAAPRGMAAQVVQHPMHAMIAPIVGAPLRMSTMRPAEDPGQEPAAMSQSDIAGIGGDQPMPTLPAQKQPKVVTMSPTDRYEDNINRRLMADYSKDQDPWGSADNHPGFLGKLGHFGSQLIANAHHVSGELTPRETEEQRLGGEVQKIEGEKSQQALQGEQAKLTGANAAHVQAETPEVAPNAESEREEKKAQTGNLQSETEARNQALAQGPSLANAYAHAVNQAIQAGRDPAQDPIVQHLSDAITSLQKEPVTPPGTKTVQLQIGGKPHQVLVDERTGETVKDLGESGEKPPTVRVNMGEGRAAKNDLLKAYQPTLDSAERMNVMTESYEKAIKDHDQQAMLNLLANHLGMTMGLQKGARLTKDIINEAKQSLPWLAGMQSKFDKDGYLSGVTLSPNQMRQMVALGQSRYAEDAKKSRATAQYLGAKDDGPMRDPSEATQRYYLGQTNGDASKARQLMKNDGWTF